MCVVGEYRYRSGAFTFKGSCMEVLGDLRLDASSVLFRLSVSLPCIGVVRLILLLPRESLKLNQRGGAFVLHSFILKNALCCFESISSLLLRSSETFCYLDDILHGVASDRDAAKNHDVSSFGLSKGVLPG